MTDPILQMYIPAFMLVAACLTIFWALFRKNSNRPMTTPDSEVIKSYKRLKRVSRYFWIIFTIFGIMAIIYSAFPEFYYLFLPLDQFHHPVINTIGLLIMKISILWIVLAQIHIDKELYKYSRDIESLSAMELVRYSEKMLITGMLVLFIGFFTTITNIIGLLLVVSGVLIYFNLFCKNNLQRYNMFFW